MKKSKPLKLAELTSELVGRSYRPGVTDCLGVILKCCETWRVAVPDEFEGYTRENYLQLYQADPERAKAVFLRLVATLGREIPPVAAFAGDFLILKVKKTGEAVVGIHAGGDLFISAFLERGVDVVSLRAYDIVNAYRWRAE